MTGLCDLSHARIKKILTGGGVGDGGGGVWGPDSVSMYFTYISQRVVQDLPQEATQEVQLLL